MQETTTKSLQRKISISELPLEIPDFTSSYEPKESVIKKWIINWIISAIKAKKIKENDILPGKSELSNYLGVSTGTVQNAIRYVEDEGFLKSKQKLGTMISNVSNPISPILKSTTKRDKVILAIKKIIIMNHYKIGKPVPSTRKMSEYLDISQNTVRLAYEYLCTEGILETLQMRGNDSNWYLKTIPSIDIKELKSSESLISDTIVDKLTETLKSYFTKNFEIGDKIPPHKELAQKMNVSIKTINDCIKRLNNEGIIITRRGKYGSILAQNPQQPLFDTLKENSIFTKAQDSEFYFYQKIETKLLQLINENYNSGDKLPGLVELARMYDVSTNTIRKALMPLEQKGYIELSRGRFGGIYLIQKPEVILGQQYKWLSINPNFI